MNFTTALQQRYITPYENLIDYTWWNLHNLYREMILPFYFWIHLLRHTLLQWNCLRQEHLTSMSALMSPSSDGDWQIQAMVLEIILITRLHQSNRLNKLNSFMYTQQFFRHHLSYYKPIWLSWTMQNVIDRTESARRKQWRSVPMPRTKTRARFRNKYSSSKLNLSYLNYTYRATVVVPFCSMVIYKSGLLVLALTHALFRTCLATTPELRPILRG